jgi:rod shape-determining protein MreD
MPVPSVVVALRSVLLLVVTLLMVTVGARTPAAALPDLVLPVVVAGALLSGPSRGALLGLGAGWLIDVIPPGSSVLGTNALLYAAAGLLAGAGRREGEAPWGWVALVGTGTTGLVVAGRVLIAAFAGTPLQWAATGVGLLLTATVCALAVPLLVTLEQSLLRRSTR